MPLKITLDGLVCHVGPNAAEKTHAVLVDKASSRPKLEVEAQYVLKPSRKAIREALVRGDVVTFTGGGLPAGPAKTTSEFTRLVPGLKALLEDADAAKKDIDPRVLSLDEDQDGALVYVNYRGGSLTAVKEVGVLVFKASDGTSLGEQPVADEAELTSTTTGPITLTIERRKSKKTDTYTLTADAVVTIRNRVRANHFDKYRHLTLAGKIASARRKGLVLVGILRVFTSDNPECTNSGWP